jgi:hypothetical protein
MNSLVNIARREAFSLSNAHKHAANYTFFSGTKTTYPFAKALPYLMTKRFISDNAILKSIKRPPAKLLVRESRRDPNVKTVLALLEKEKYTDVARIVREKKISIDSHDRWENTPLTESAKRGDLKAVQFLINEMGANPHASCDCPYHKTALHYAAENGHQRVVEELIRLGASVNALDSRNYTALDVAKTKEIEKVLIANSGTYGKNVKVTQVLNLPKADCPLRLK